MSVVGKELLDDAQECWGAEAFLERIETPDTLSEVAALLAISARLVETAAYGAARSVDSQAVTDLFLIAARLEARSDAMRNTAAKR